ncbi:hypothetical protein JOD29_000873 [Lysinibacillus composti]|uniref:Uncharacterized protein n=1 Tax=Lysinibacillus composti TaxID=720633 RepID=A0A3N9UIG7_9BACI|nr:hypothetical protein [Lysinibacillus composti]MBM7607629.1 hypothetical protein [Lysinibacillus composti]RQW75869.1 hypothetical protein EBB45_04435 [Lysinibacillus composti]
MLKMAGPCHRCQKYKCQCKKKREKSKKTELKVKDLFGSPFDCEEQIRTRRFASPNSALSPQELDELQECIEKANDILRSLVAENDPTNKRQLQLHFLKLRGASVEVKILCTRMEQEEEEENEMDDLFAENEDEDLDLIIPPHKKIIKVCGKVATAGRDFIQFNGVGSAYLVLYNQLLSVASDKTSKSKQPQRDFIDANQETRRKLAFNFGEFVANNPDAKNIFFGIPLSLQLNQFIGKEVCVETTDDGSSEGLLVRVDEELIEIEKKCGDKIEIDFDKMCFILIRNLK